MMACRNGSVDNITLAAADQRDIVTQEVGTNETDHHVSGSVGWYYSPNYSWGFFEAGTDLDRNSCDFQPTDALDQRLCWHTDTGGGYRCGTTTNLNSNSTWQRLILTY